MWSCIIYGDSFTGKKNNQCCPDAFCGQYCRSCDKNLILSDISDCLQFLSLLRNCLWNYLDNNREIWTFWLWHQYLSVVVRLFLHPFQWWRQPLRSVPIFWNGTIHRLLKQRELMSKYQVFSVNLNQPAKNTLIFYLNISKV